MAEIKIRDGSDETQGLLTRHVFLDTEVYRRFGHDLNSAPLRALGRHIEEESLVLHITDITLSEIERQILDEAATLAHDLGKIDRKLERWKARGAAGILPDLETIDGPLLGSSIYNSLCFTIRFDWKATEHLATKVSAGLVFDSYFQRRPPFDNDKSKEFPDAFVIAALADWCAKRNSTMYVITKDAAMQRTATASGVLIPVPGLPEMLQIATAAETPEIVGFVDRLLASPEFVEPVHDFLRDRIGWLGVVYDGDH